MTEQVTIGQRIREKREAEGLTQPELATRLGVKSLTTISRWENDHRLPDEERKAYDRLMAWLSNGEESK